jgi:hypothetical protein
MKSILALACLIVLICVPAAISAQPNPQCENLQKAVDNLRLEREHAQEILGTDACEGSARSVCMRNIRRVAAQLQAATEALRNCSNPPPPPPLPIEAGGPRLTTSGRKKLVTQGVTYIRLFADKHILLGLALTDAEASNVGQLSFTIRYPGGSTSEGTVTSSDLLRLFGELSAFELPGTQFPWAGTYGVTLMARSANSRIVATSGPMALTFHPTKDVRLLVSLIVKPGRPGLEANSTWYSELEAGLRRLNAMLPIRDGVAALNADTHSGLRYTTIECNGFAPPGFYPKCTYGRTRAINATSGDHIDVTVEWRPGLYSGPNQTDDHPGGNSGRMGPPYSDLRRASCVSGVYRQVSMDGSCIAQEVGHNFGLEPATSPHYQDPGDPGHSKDPSLGDRYAYDFEAHRPLPLGPDGIVGDVMNNNGGGANEGQDSAAFNAFDFNYLLDQFQSLPSTGSGNPSLPAPILGIGMDNELFTRATLFSPWVKVPNSGNVIGVTVMPNGTIVGIGMGNELFLRATLTSPWVKVPNSGSVIGVASIPSLAGC